jgi:hypothetical protein
MLFDHIFYFTAVIGILNKIKQTTQNNLEENKRN